MRSRMMPGLLVMLLGWILAPGLAQAVALGKIDVTSHLGEAFYAEVPLHLEKNEKLSGLSVEIATPSDYRILEVYRDPVLNRVRASVQDDKRGTRVKLVSDASIESPFFNLVLKVHYGNATSFKKYPVFLDLPSAQVSMAKPAPAKAASAAAKPAPAPAAETGTTAQKSDKGGKPFKPFSGWARNGRYGPMVYGDTLMTVARRLRVDDRYTLKQVMVALFDKNKEKFDKNNMNLIKAGSYLDVPTAKEVEAITPRHAREIVAKQGREWKQLKKQPHYAAVAEAQKHRYSGKIRVGKTAVGVAAAGADSASDDQTKGTKGGKLATSADGESSAADTAAAKGKKAQDDTASTTGKLSPEQAALQQQNNDLQKKLKQANDNIDALNAKLSSSDLAASNARIKKLELKLARMQTELDAARQQAAVAARSGFNDWLIYGLAGLAIVLLAVIGYLLRRERPHPAAQFQQESDGGFDEDDFVTPPVAGMYGAGETEEPRSVVDEEGQDEAPVSSESSFFGEAEEPGETEAAGEEAEDRNEMPPEVDPNVDYVAEADVYLRYGMEDEALRQLRMAIRQRQDNVDAHCKLVKLLQMRDEQDELDGAIEAGRQALSGDDLARFESEVALLGAEGADEADTSTDETPATESVDLDEELSADFSVAGEAGSGEEDTDIPTVGVSAGDESEETGEVDLSDTAGGDDSGLDVGELDWSPFGETPGHEETPEETAPESPEMETDTDLTAATDSDLSMDEVRGDEADAEHDDVDSAADSVEEPDSDAPDTSDLGGLEGGLDFDDVAVEEPEHAEEVSSSVEEGTDEAAETPPAREEGEAIDLDLSSLMLDETGDEEERAGTEEAATSEPDNSGDDHDVSSELDSLLDELGVDADMDAPKSDDGVTAGSLAIDMARSLVARGELDDAETAFKSALEGDFRCQGLLGMAEVAQQRGDAATADEMLAQAEPLLGDDTREWFETLKEKQGE